MIWNEITVVRSATHELRVGGIVAHVVNTGLCVFVLKFNKRIVCGVENVLLLKSSIDFVSLLRYIFFKYAYTLDIFLDCKEKRR